jgi:HPt (histidine-containing phosphotransfer) domain-containing protein
MSNLSKRSTIYFDPAIHQALKIKAASSNLSVSEIVDEAIRIQLAEDQEDLAIFDARVKELEMSYEALLKDLKKHGKI